MKNTLLVWHCPVCVGDEPIIRGSQEHLDMAVAAHILRHEEKASLIAVDRARLQCTHTECSIGRKNHQNLSIGNPNLALTEFDKTLLQAMKIGVDQ